MQGLEIYSGMRVIVKALDGKMLFLANYRILRGIPQNYINIPKPVIFNI